MQLRQTVLAMVVGLALWLNPFRVTAAAEFVPFKGVVTGNAVSTPTSNPAVVLVNFSGAGNASHLGQFTANAQYFLNTMVFPTLLRVTDGAFIFTGANGDTIHGTFDGQGHFTEDPNVITLDATAVIAGGTGRFTGASGSFHSVSGVDLSADRIQTVFNGVVSAPGLNKK
jgi:hypothetical protein